MGTPLPPQIVELAATKCITELFDLALFGCVSVQLYYYYQAFPNDRTVTKSLVYSIYVLELVHIIMVIQDAFITYGLHFSDLSILTKELLVFETVPILGGLVSFSAQSFYAYRIHVLSASWLMPCIIVIIALTSSVAAVMIGIFISQVAQVQFIQNFRIGVAVGIWCGGSALCDVLIAIWMTYHLTKKNTGFRQTHVTISRLIRLIVETGSMTALFALAAAILFLKFPDRVYYIGPTAVLPALYCIAVLVILNSRMEIVGGRGIDASHVMAVFNSSENVVLETPHAC